MDESQRLRRIEDLRAQLADAVEAAGSVHSPAVVELSRQLDRLLADGAPERTNREPTGEVPSSL